MAETDVKNSMVERLDREYPEFWDAFLTYTFRLIDAGHNHYSARAVVDRVRWHYHSKKRRLRIGNNLTPLLARRFHDQFPRNDGFFVTRPLRQS